MNFTLNPIFTESEILYSRYNIFSAHEKIQKLLESINELENKEMILFKNKRIMDFKPSNEILEKIKEVCVWKLYEDGLLRDLFSMIETNINVLQSKLTIENAYIDYKEKIKKNFIILPSHTHHDHQLVVDKFNYLIQRLKNNRWINIDYTLNNTGDSFWSCTNLWDDLPHGSVGTKNDYESKN